MCHIFQIADCDDPFEEMKRARRYPGARSERVPRANVAPFVTETNPNQKTNNTPFHEQNINEEANKAPAVSSLRRKRVCVPFHYSRKNIFSWVILFILLCLMLFVETYRVEMNRGRIWGVTVQPAQRLNKQKLSRNQNCSYEDGTHKG